MDPPSRPSPRRCPSFRSSRGPGARLGPPRSSPRRPSSASFAASLVHPRDPATGAPRSSRREAPRGSTATVDRRVTRVQWKRVTRKRVGYGGEVRVKSNVVVSEAGRIWAYLARGSLGVPESLRAGHRPPELIAAARWQGPEQTQEVVPARHADGGADELEGGATNQCSRARRKQRRRSF